MKLGIGYVTSPVAVHNSFVMPHGSSIISLVVTSGGRVSVRTAV